MTRNDRVRSRAPHFSLRSLLILKLVFTPALFLTPTDPFRGDPDTGLDEITHAEAQKIHETSKIYSILAAGWADLGESAGWAIARAIRAESHRYSLDPMLVLAVIHVESRFSPTAVSDAGARGLMQILPSVARGLVEEAELKDWDGDGSLADPIFNIRLGIFYLDQLKKSFRDIKLALTAYNLGPTAVRQLMEDGGEISLAYADKVFSVHHTYRKQKPRREPIPPTHRGKEKI